MQEDLWTSIKNEVTLQISREPILSGYLKNRVLRHASMSRAISDLMSVKLGSAEINANALRLLFDDVLEADPDIIAAVTRDLLATRQRDPAVLNYSTAMLYFKGFHALQSYRIAHSLWQQGRKQLALYLQSQISEKFCVDIHPAATIGSGILIDHATGIVIGETCILDDDISIMQGVTLGGTGKDVGDRHPKIRAGVLIGAGANIIGNVIIGEGAKVGAGSVVLNDVDAHTTVAGVPAVVVGRPDADQPALDMNHGLNVKN
ncbi:MAG: serine O-acetyltransferase [Pseudomonadales bacterium]|nr:serine O-acetyltransferase [Pseudomonadales bacterium]